MEEELRQSYSYPELWVSTSGKIFYSPDGKNMTPVEIVYEHTGTVKGPTTKYRHNKRIKYLSVFAIMFEIFIKGEPANKKDYYAPIDGNWSNFNPENITSDKRGRRKYVPDKEEEYLWMGGNEIYY